MGDEAVNSNRQSAAGRQSCSDSCGNSCGRAGQADARAGGSGCPAPAAHLPSTLPLPMLPTLPRMLLNRLGLRSDRAARLLPPAAGLGSVAWLEVLQEEWSRQAVGEREVYGWVGMLRRIGYRLPLLSDWGPAIPPAPLPTHPPN